MVKRASWLSVTPEPERELPEAVATLAAGRRADDREVARERERIERLVLRGSQRRWLDYLHHVVALIEARGGLDDPDVARARSRAAGVIPITTIFCWRYREAAPPTRPAIASPWHAWSEATHSTTTTATTEEPDEHDDHRPR